MSSAYVPPHRRRNNNNNNNRNSSNSSNRRTATATATTTANNSHNDHRQADQKSKPNWKTESHQRHRDEELVEASSQQQQQQEATTATVDRLTLIRCINLRRREDRWGTFCSRMESTLVGYDDDDEVGGGRQFISKVKRFDAVDGTAIMETLHQEENNDDNDNDNVNEIKMIMPNLEWDATKNSMYDRHIEPPMIKIMTPGEVGCAMSHIRLWQQLANYDNDSCDNSNTDPEEEEANKSTPTMLILEDDAVFYRNKIYNDQRGRGRGNYNPKGGRENYYKNQRNNNNSINRIPGFIDALTQTWNNLPSDWDILYLGFSDRGERKYIHDQQQQRSSSLSSEGITINIFQPTYGFHTHAYVITKSAANVLLSNLPVNGPLDVWLADNEWFGLKVYCSVVANEGWKNQGALLISQRRHDTKSDIGMSGRAG